MKSGLSSTLRQLVIPNGVLLAAAVLLLPWKLQAIFAPPEGEFIALAIAAAGVLLAWRLRSPRLMLMLMLVLLLVTERASMWAWAGHVGPGESAVRTALAVLLPLNVAVLLLVDDAYVDWEAFAWWGGLIAVQAIVMAVILGTGEASALRRLGQPLIPQLLSGSRVPQLATLLFLASGVALLVAFLVTRKPRESGLFWSLCACFLAVSAGNPRLGAGYFAAAGVIVGASVIETAYLVGYHDELTGLPARRAFNQAVAALDGEYAIAMVDIDHFKRFNDTFGHDAGDQVLRLVASKMMEVGGDGKAFRYGGEEFAIVFRRATAEDALEHAEVLRGLIAETNFVVRGLDRSRRSRTERRYRHRPRKLRKQRFDTRVTISIGLAEPTDPATPVEDVVRAADQALYRAKERGRNRVEMHVARRPRAKVEHAT
ncbi:MAG TPA: GGDEF domain-containing protein [Terriglobales bacterium]|nr:GGDEF domain-containing protein [Terriglobales bacterium]